MYRNHKREAREFKKFGQADFCYIHGIFGLYCWFEVNVCSWFALLDVADIDIDVIDESSTPMVGSMAISALPMTQYSQMCLNMRTCSRGSPVMV
jgi:hypothetical protein